LLDAACKCYSLVHASTLDGPAVRQIHYCFSFNTQIPKTCQRDCGPNLYIAPKGCFTYLHQDGNGNVDSGHFCFKGFNEVLMLKRGTEKEMKRAEEILVGTGEYDSNEPHYNGKKPPWPTTEKIDECRSELG
jgi:hypothetical protein